MEQEQDQTVSLVRQGWQHLHLQRSLAAWATWQRVLQTHPDDQAAIQALDHLENLEELPAAARTVYRFQNPSDPERRQRWDLHLRNRNLENLEDAAKIFRTLSEEASNDAEALLNLALCLTWLGRNAEAISRLDQVVGILAETAPERAADAWTLAEVLRFGAGAEHLADDLRCVWTLEGPDLPDDSFFQGWPNLVPIAIPVDPLTGSPVLQQAEVYDWLDRSLVSSPDLVAKLRTAEVPRKLASVILAPGLLKLTTPDPTTFSAIEDRDNTEVQLAFQHARRELSPLPMAWADAALSSFRLPESIDFGRRNTLTRELVERYYENIWIQQPRHGLGSRSPLEAARLAASGDVRLRVKLLGIIRFREQLSIRATHLALYQGYPFDRLRRRLGLLSTDLNPTTLDPLDVSCMSETELGTLDPATLDDYRLIEALESISPFLNDQKTVPFCQALLARRLPSINRIEPQILVAPLLRLALKWVDPTAVIEEIESVAASYDSAKALTIRLWCAEILARSNHPQAAFDRYVQLAKSPDGPFEKILQEGVTILEENGHPDWAEKLAQLFEHSRNQ